MTSPNQMWNAKTRAKLRYIPSDLLPAMTNITVLMTLWSVIVMTNLENVSLIYLISISIAVLRS